MSSTQRPFAVSGHVRRLSLTRLGGPLACALALLAIAAPTRAGAPGPEPIYETPPVDVSSESSESTEVPSAVVTPSTPPVDRTPPPAPPGPVTPPPRPRAVLDPAARLVSGDDASEAWTLFVELDSGHRITQRFLLTNVGPGDHSAVAVGHLVEPGRAPYRYENGRRRNAWELSDDRLFFDIAASHLDLHRPEGQLRITKDDIEIRLFFDFPARGASARVPAERLPRNYQVEVLAVGARTRGTILPPWMSEPLEVRGRTWLVHTWTTREEADLLQRRTEFYAHDDQTSFYGIHLRDEGDWESAWGLAVDPSGNVIESGINVPAGWTERAASSGTYPPPRGFSLRDGALSGEIGLAGEWLRFDPLDVIPQPFRWFIRRSSQPQEVWADAQISVSLSFLPGSPSLPTTGVTTSAESGTPVRSSDKSLESSRAKRETDAERTLIAAPGSANGVASITFLNPDARR